MPEYVPRRIGEILRPPVLAGAALGGVLSLLWLRRRALPGRGRGRHRGGRVRRVRGARPADQHPLRVPGGGDPAASSAAPACSAGRACERERPAAALVDGRRRRWSLLALLAYAPSQYRAAHRELRQTRPPAADRRRPARRSSTTTRSTCAAGRSACPTMRPIPLLALYLKTSPRRIVQRPGRQHRHAASTSTRPAGEVERDYVLDKRDPHAAVTRAAGLQAGGDEPLVADLHALRIADRAPLVEISATGRLIAARHSGPGAPAAPAGDRLRLLPSGPDLVRKPTPRGTRTIDAPGDGATGAEPLGGEFSPARADCGYRAPLPPRLARSAPIVTHAAHPRRGVPIGCATVTNLKSSPTLALLALAPAIALRDARRCGPDRRLRLERLEQHDHDRQREQRRQRARQDNASARRLEPRRRKTPTSGPLSTEPTRHDARRRRADETRDQGPHQRHRAGSQSRPDRHRQLRRRALQRRQGVRRFLETQRTVHVHARPGRGHQRLGPGRRRHEGRRPASS